MSDAIITVENVSKKYLLGKSRAAGDGLRHAFHDFATAPLRWLRSGGRKTEDSSQPELTSDLRLPTADEFWALKDVSFEVKQGEVIGIIGRNGAGKSTLLKILSRITEPTTGRIRIKGRVASLLEVGTGFHQELTGRENIFLNGAILGMNRAEIKRKFDEIVAFAEVEKFLDTPVKRYSSGMYVRLAFAVAAHLEPEILIVDEVLAVGDSEFQKKCIGKMKDVSKGGRTVLFVSHNMNAVTALCKSIIVLQSGSLKYQGDIQTGLHHYGASTQVSNHIDFSKKPAFTTQHCLRSIRIKTDNQETELLYADKDVNMTANVEVAGSLTRPRLSIAFANSKGDRVFAVASWLGSKPLRQLQGSQIIQIHFRMPPIAPGFYTLDIGFYDAVANVCEEHFFAGAVEVAESNYLQMLEPNSNEMGQFLVRSDFSIASQ